MYSKFSILATSLEVSVSGLRPASFETDAAWIPPMPMRRNNIVP